MPKRLRNTSTWALLCLSSLAGSPGAGNRAEAKPRPVAKAPPPSPATAPESEELDLGDKRDRLKVLTDGKHHYVAVVPFGREDDTVFYGDGKAFYSQRIRGSGATTGVSFDKYFWEPRTYVSDNARLSFKNEVYTVKCREHETVLQVLPDPEAKALLAAAKFYKPRWQHQAYLLARDNTGRYYYVDRTLEQTGKKNFRLYAGPQGALKLQKMINVVSDSEGDIFATKTGELRLVVGRSESMWVSGKSSKKLVQVPIDSNHVLIYTDLGVYTGQPLGTPCDDL